MDIIWAIGQIVYALLAFLGLVVVIVVAWIEGAPRFRRWAEDVRSGYRQYRLARCERQLREEAVGAVARAQQLIELAKDRMVAAVRSDS